MFIRKLPRVSELPALVASVLAVTLLALAFQWCWPAALDLGGLDRRFINGFNAIEDFNGLSVRWTTGDATIALPRPSDNAPSLLTLRTLNSRPPGQPGPLLHLSADDRLIGDFVVAQDLAGARVNRVLLPGTTSLDWRTVIRLQSDTFTPAGDQRLLGVVVDRAVLLPLSARPLLPPLWLVVWGALLGLLAYALMRLIGMNAVQSASVAVVLAALLAWGCATRTMEVLPFVRRVALLLGVGCVGMWIARLLAPPQAAGVDRWTVRGTDVPIYLAVAWWLAPLFQMAMLADGAFNVGPAPQTRVIGVGLWVVIAGVFGGWYVLRRREGKQKAESRKQLVEGSLFSGSSLRSSVFGRFALVLLAAGAGTHLVYMIWFAFTRSGPDFWILFKGARDWTRGGSLYDIGAVIANHFGHVFKVPPFYGMLFVPFVSQDGDRILFFHRVMNTVLLVATAMAWLRMWRLSWRSASAAGVLILLNARPIADTMAFGQIDLELLCILTLALWSLRGERDLLAGGLVALGTLLKIYPVLLLAFFVVKGRWRAVAGWILGMLVLNSVAVAVMGWEMHRVYLFEVLPRIGGTTSWVENQTIFGFLARLVSSPKEVAILRNPAVSLLGDALAGCALLLACYVSLRPARPTSTTYALQYSLFLLLMVLVVPAAWMHYETLLFIPFASLILHWRERAIALSRVAALALAFALIAYGNQWSFYDGTVMGVLTIIGVSYKFYGMLLLGGVLTAPLLEERVPQSVVSGRWSVVGSR